MTDLQELIAMADKLCSTLDMVAENDKKFSNNVCQLLEDYSWDALRMRNNLIEISEYVGV